MYLSGEDIYGEAEFRDGEGIPGERRFPMEQRYLHLEFADDQRGIPVSAATSGGPFPRRRAADGNRERRGVYRRDIPEMSEYQY